MSDCDFECNYDYDEVWYEEKITLTDDNDKKCIECGSVLVKGSDCIELCTMDSEEQLIKELVQGHLCLDCHSLLWTFGGCAYTQLHTTLHETLVECNLQVEQSKIDKLTPGAKEKLLAVMDEIMRDKENE